jgi:hypothetical protein
MSTNPNKGIGGKIPIVLICAGMILMVVQTLSNPALYFQKLFNQVESPSSFSFSNYEGLLKSAVKDKLVDYALLAQNKKVLNECVEKIAKTSDAGMKDEKTRLAYLINCYNLIVLKTWVDAYPKILKEKPADIKQRYSKTNFLIGGKTYSINSFSNEVLIPLIKQREGYPLFLLCGGTKGFPSLQNHFITASSLNDDCVEALGSYMTDNKNVLYDDLHNTLYISPFFLWYQDTLTTNGQTPHQWVLAHLPNSEEIAASSENHTLTELYFKQFDWSINNFQTQLPVPPNPSSRP